MNLGKLEKENDLFVREHKKFGYATKTQLTNDAITYFRKLKEQEMRESWLKSSFEEIRNEKKDCVFETIDGEDFVD